MEERETRAISLWEQTRYELVMAEKNIESAQLRPGASSRDRPADPGPGQVVISVEEDERRRSESALADELTKRVDILRGDLIRVRAEADEWMALLQNAEARERKLQYALDKAGRAEHMLRDRVREWEDFHEEFQRQGNSHGDDRRDDVREEPADRDRESLARQLARAAADGRSTIGSTSSGTGGWGMVRRMLESGRGLSWTSPSSCRR